MRFFEDYQIGETFHTKSRTITAEEVDSFVEYIGVRNPLFTDAEHAKKTPFHKRIVPGFLTQSLALGLLYQPHIIQNFLLTKAQTHFLKPLHIQDTIHLTGKITAKKTTPKAKTGHLTLHTNINNQNNQKIANMTITISILKQPHTHHNNKPTNT